MINQNLALLESIHQAGEERLEQNFSSIYRVKNVDQWYKEVDLDNVEIIITRGKGKIRQEYLDLMPKLKVIARCGVGVDNIDVSYAQERGIKVLNAPNFLSETVAEHTIMMILNLVRQAVPYYQHVKDGQWSKRSLFTGDDCRGKTLGIIGLGSIGLTVAHLANAFGMKIIYNSYYCEENPYESLEVDEVLERADIVSLHVALTPQTHHLVDKSFLTKMKKGSYLINLGRGELVQQEHVLESLSNDHLAGFAADVFVPEPPEANDELIKHPRTLITPHIAALTDRTYKNMSVQTVKNIIALFKGSLDKRFIVG